MLSVTVPEWKSPIGFIVQRGRNHGNSSKPHYTLQRVHFVRLKVDVVRVDEIDEEQGLRKR